MNNSIILFGAQNNLEPSVLHWSHFHGRKVKLKRCVRGPRRTGARSVGCKALHFPYSGQYRVRPGCGGGSGLVSMGEMQKGQKAGKDQGQVWNNEASTEVKGATLLASA